MKTRRETIIGYKKAKEALENGYEVICYHSFKAGITSHLFDPGSEEICERIRSDAWSKLRTECHLARSENRRSTRSKDYFWKLGPAPTEAKPTEHKDPEPQLMLYTFGCNTYGDKLVTIQIPAMTRDYAATIARQMMNAAREIIDIDEGLWLNDEEAYE